MGQGSYGDVSPYGLSAVVVVVAPLLGEARDELQPTAASGVRIERLEHGIGSALVVNSDAKDLVTELNDQCEAGTRVVHDVCNEFLDHDERILDDLGVDAPVLEQDADVAADSSADRRNGFMSGGHQPRRHRV